MGNIPVGKDNKKEDLNTYVYLDRKTDKTFDIQAASARLASRIVDGMGYDIAEAKLVDVIEASEVK